MTINIRNHFVKLKDINFEYDAYQKPSEINKTRDEEKITFRRFLQEKSLEMREIKKINTENNERSNHEH